MKRPNLTRDYPEVSFKREPTGNNFICTIHYYPRVDRIEGCAYETRPGMNGNVIPGSYKEVYTLVHQRRSGDGMVPVRSLAHSLGLLENLFFERLKIKNRDGRKNMLTYLALYNRKKLDL